jgi:2-polyprenyl-3-methyl-5-hydroxy-6-metoxy-1,4-benzoquinol methylase
MPAVPADRDHKAFFYESFAEEWDERMDRDELDKRLRLVFSRLLGRQEVQGKRVLDAGAGIGHFSQTLADWGALLVSVDMGPALLRKVRQKSAAQVVAGSILDLPFPDQTFDVVLCTEVVEHTTDPSRAVAELCRVAASGSLLVLTTPNRLWKAAVVVANALRLRPYRGYENWVGYRQLAKWVRAAGMRVEQQSGFNLLPHTFFCRRRFDFLDRISPLHRFMINIAIRARRPG